VIQATLSNSGFSRTLAFTIGGDGHSATYSASDIPAGYYTLAISLYDGTTKYDGSAALVRIWAGASSTGSFTFSRSSPSTGSVDVVVAVNLNDPLTVAISGGAAYKKRDEAMSLSATATGAEGTYSYQWYVNGESRGTGSAFVFDASWAIGDYQIDVIAYSADGTQAGIATLSTYVGVTELSVTFDYGVSSTSSGNNIYAIWIEDAEDGVSFVQHLYVCERLKKSVTGQTGTALPYWRTNYSTEESDANIDAVTGATVRSADFTVSGLLRDENIRKFTVYVEMDRSFEPNDWFTGATSSDLNDQPALLYSATVDRDDWNGDVQLSFAGWSPNTAQAGTISGTSVGALNTETRYITNHKVDDTPTFGDADTNSATKMVGSLTFHLE